MPHRPPITDPLKKEQYRTSILAIFQFKGRHTPLASASTYFQNSVSVMLIQTNTKPGSATCNQSPV